MSALLGKAGKKLFENHLENYAPADPLYEFYTDEQGRQKRRKACHHFTFLTGDLITDGRN
ncbi:hypothetical protein H1R20_g14236, partial [Candolleomyces eurysporus]